MIVAVDSSLHLFLANGYPVKIDLAGPISLFGDDSGSLLINNNKKSMLKMKYFPQQLREDNSFLHLIYAQYLRNVHKTNCLD